MATTVEYKCGVKKIKHTTASCWSSTAVWGLTFLLKTKTIIFDSMRELCQVVWHLVLPQICGSSIQDWWLDRVMRGVPEGLWSIRFHKTSWLWTFKQFMYSENGECGRTTAQWEQGAETKLVGVELVYCGVVCKYVPTYWSRSRNMTPPCPWSASWRSSMAEQDTVGTAIWPPGASLHSTDSTSTHANLAQPK